MLTQDDNSLDRKDTVRVIEKILQRSKLPLSAGQIQKSLPGPFKMDVKKLDRVLKEQSGRGFIHQWLPKRNKKRYWHRQVEEYARETMEKLLEDQPLKIKEMEVALRKRLFDCSATKAGELRSKILKDLLESKRVLKHPRLPRQQADRYGIHPPDPAPYLGKLKKAFDEICIKLKTVGLMPEDIFQAAHRVLVPDAATPLPDSGRSGIHRLILNKIMEIEPAAGQQALVSIRELRAAMNLPADRFDQVVLDLAEREQIWLHRHAYPEQAKAEEIVRDNRGNCYMGLVLRS